MADIVIRAPRRDDIAALVSDMRAADRQEMEATHGAGADLHDAVRHALNISSLRFAMEADGQLALLMGAAPVSLLGGIGSPWMLGTTLLDRLPGALTRTGITYLDVARDRYPILVNYVDARNTKSIRWLKRLGFTVADEPVPYGPQRMPFYRFELRSNHV